MGGGSEPFSDVTSANWFYDDVQYAYEHGILSGTGADRFSPSGKTGRGMAATVMYRMAGSPETASVCKYKDVKNGKYYELPIVWGTEENLVTGTGEDVFSPDRSVTREQLVTMLYRYAVYKGYDTSAAADLSGYKDAGKVSAYAKPGMSWAVAKGMISGTASGKERLLDPKGEVTRAQLAAILRRFVEGNTEKIPPEKEPEPDKKDPEPSPTEPVSGGGSGGQNSFDDDSGPSGSTIFFESNGGSSVEKQYVRSGESAKEPAVPTYEGFVFEGWYTDKDFSQAYDFTAKVNKGLTLYAKWRPQLNYTVSFESNGGSAVEAQSVPEGSCATRPENPAREGYQFLSWSTSPNFSDIYNFTEEVTADTILYARWTVKNVDGVIDLSDVENLISSGMAEVSFRENGEVRAIDGMFTEQTVNSKEDAVNVLCAAKPLLSSGMSVTADDISVQSVEDSELPKESFYRFNPKVNGVEVYGSEIIIATDANGATTGLFNYYDKDIESVDTVATVTEDSAVSIAIADVMQMEEIAEALDAMVAAGNDRETVETAFRDSLDSSVRLVVNTGDDQLPTALMYIVDVFTKVEIPDIEEELAEENPSEETENIPEENPQKSEENTGDNNAGTSETASETDTTAVNPVVTACAVDTAVVSETGELSAVEETGTGTDGTEVFLQGTDVNATDGESNGASDETAADGNEAPAEGEEETLEPVLMPMVHYVYYIYANGSQAGQIGCKLDGAMTYAPVVLSSQDSKGKICTYNAAFADGEYVLYDTVRNIKIYKSDNGFLPGIMASSTGGNAGTIDPYAVSMLTSMAKAYDFYEDVLGRTSYDGNGKEITVSYDSDGVDNSYWYWSSQRFEFGDKDAWKDSVSAVDLVGHEFSHAVISYVVGTGDTAGLEYSGETGALNEAYVDIMGSLCEGKTDDAKWSIGEDMGMILRDLSDPAKCGNPAHYSALSDPAWLEYINRFPDADNGGVHIFSTIFSHAAYKMMTDTRTSFMSDEAWAKIFYRSLNRLGTKATFLDARNAVLASTRTATDMILEQKDLHELISWTPQGAINQVIVLTIEELKHCQRQAIKDAFDAVGIKESNCIKFVLNWGETPRDLDSHLVGPAVDGSGRFHIFYSNRCYYQDGSYYSDDSSYAADLDYDDTTSYGPEITTIHTLTPGDYYFYVHDYTNRNRSNSTAMAKSEATVDVYYNGRTEPVRFGISEESSGTYWNVVKVTISDSGNITLTKLDTYGNTASYQ